MKNIKVSLGFTRIPDADLVTFTKNVIAKLTDNASFPKPGVSLADLTTALNTFADAMAKARFNDRQAIAERNKSRDALLALLRQEAAWVQSVGFVDDAVLLSSGFEPAASGGSRSRSALSRVVIDDISNEQSTKLTVKLQALDNARAYEVRMSYGTNGWQAVGMFTNSRRILLENLTPGTVYTVQARAIGTTGYSEWSDPVPRMAT